MQSYPFTIFHSGYIDEVANEKKKSERNMRIFQSMKRTGDKNDPLYNFTLANEFMVSKNYEQALYYYQQAYARSKPHDKWYPFCLERYIVALISTERYMDAYDLVETAVSRYPGYTDFHCLKAMILHHFGMIDQAISLFERCIAIVEQSGKIDKPFWLVGTQYGATIPYQLLAESYYTKLDLPKTVFYSTRLLNQNPRSVRHLYRLAKILSLSEQPAEIIALMEQIYSLQDHAQCSLLFHVFLDAGNPNVAKYYFQKCNQDNLTTTSVLRYALLVRDHSLYSRTYSQSPQSEGIAHFLTIASLVWPEHRSRPNQELYDDHEKLYRLLIDLFALQCFEPFDQIVGQVKTPELIQRLAHYFYHEHHLELALDYYDVLIQNHAMDAIGFQNLGSFCINKGMVEEGIAYLQQAVDLDPNLSNIPFLASHITDPMLKQTYKEKFADLYPQHKMLPFILEL